jgi:glycosyltransferase involved in cell wall biosynthesis
MERYLELTLPALARAGAQLLVVTGAIDGTPPDTIETIVAGWPEEHAPPDARAARQVAEIARDFDPSVIVAHNLLDAGILNAARSYTSRFVYHVHDHRPFCPNGDRVYPRGGAMCSTRMGDACMWHALVHGCAYGFRPKTGKLIDRRVRARDAIARADAIVANSSFMARSAARNGIDEARLSVAMPPLSDDAFATPIAPPPSQPSVLFVGRVVPQKGLEHLIRALATMDAVHRPQLRIAGEGPALPAALELARNLHVPYETLGTIASARVREAMDESSLVAIPSLWAEPFGMVGPEAHARGRSVVAYDVGGISEWAAPGDGIVERGNIAAFASAIEAMLLPATWSNSSAAARAHVDTFRLGAHTDALLRTYAPAS